MFQLSIADLTRWVLSGENGVENTFIDNAYKKIDVPEVSSEQAIRNIEMMIEDISDKLDYVKDAYKKTNTIIVEEEYENDCKKWYRLYDNHEILKFDLPKAN